MLLTIQRFLPGPERINAGYTQRFNLGSSLATNLRNIQAALFFRWEYLIYYRNNNNNKAETAVIKIEKWLLIWFIYYRNDRSRLVRGSDPTED